MERTPMKAPLPCFGLEHSPVDPVCRNCKHEAQCLKFMGIRAGKIPLDKVTFDFVPAVFKEEEVIDPEDPELPMLRELYTTCYRTVFNRRPPETDRVDLYQREIVHNAHQTGCSLRMFILSNMVGQSVHEESLLVHTEKARPAPFHAKLLSGKLAITRAEKYAEVCKDRYGTFSLSSLSTFTGEEYEANDIERNLLSSEVTAGQFVVSRKIHHGGPPFEALYAEEELQLNPTWLALEKTYDDTVLKPYRQDSKGTNMQKQHRFNVTRTIGLLKRNPSQARLVHRARQRIMPQAVEQVLNYFGLRPDDLLIEAAPVKDPMDFWIQIGRTIQHYHCWLLIQGESSYFSRRIKKEIRFGS